MRKNKFRAWDKSIGKMEEDVCINECGEVIHFDYGEYAGVTDDIVMQYTGLKDKNGTEIYEGDIVECFVNGNSHVSFKGGAYGLIFDYSFIPFSDVHGEMKVIGNIYEHPHLLGD